MPDVAPAVAQKTKSEKAKAKGRLFDLDEPEPARPPVELGPAAERPGRGWRSRRSARAKVAGVDPRRGSKSGVESCCAAAVGLLAIYQQVLRGPLVVKEEDLPEVMALSKLPSTMAC